tara:strand:+ start:96 stop:497 length:402 start_codon:yes stop_codon:yes gene_type:complete
MHCNGKGGVCNSVKLFLDEGIKSWTILESYKSITKENLLKREKSYYLKEKDNPLCLNKISPIQTEEEHKEYQQNWRDTHKEYQKDYDKNKRDKEKQKQYEKEYRESGKRKPYYEKNKERLRAKRRERYRTLGK